MPVVNKQIDIGFFLEQANILYSCGHPFDVEVTVSCIQKVYNKNIEYKLFGFGID